MFVLWAAPWILVTLAWFVLLGFEWYISGPSSCPLEDGTSLYGTSAWSWFPPGQVCVWEVTVGGEPYTVTERPPVARLGILAVLLLWGVSVLTLVLRRRSGAE
ncbi:hypothetical protein GCM10007079_18680 [Nocardiopsis terrae]|uniref:Disulfide bond formation protein DsbB n=1 Tax=Nocardiopsis terrae TaxID=372655 RepID=A0ABR9HHL5_9ACTN|nr:hypothetical protein [Nocardiopsis terrae]MBE1458509.1 hypothetical protein [Nocardiopsis terrae]GHC80017.1 hypothetical protein GCM10007079_18680 [Nocardiopsis terrae]